MIARLEQEVHDLAQKLCNKLLAENKDEKDRKPFEIAHAYSCFTSDAISSYCFGEAFGLLSRNQWQPNYREATLAVLKPVLSMIDQLFSPICFNLSLRIVRRSKIVLLRRLLLSSTLELKRRAGHWL
ncbi:hypothetical protein LB505_013303 [Fusarium chuoi]|nr:hypothetical protein LB505_013303 [Fusarium chuoi]